MNSQSQPSDIMNISGPAVAAIESFLNEPVPSPDLPDSATVHALSIVTDNPRSEARAYGERLWDHYTKTYRSKVESGRSLLQREDARLSGKYDRILAALNETARNHIGYSEARSLTPREIVKLVMLIFFLVGVLGASIAVITMLLLDTGMVQSLAQAIAFGLVPTAIAFVLAEHVGGISEFSAFRSWKRSISLLSIVLVIPWTTLFVLVFGAGATSTAEDLIAQMSQGGTDLPSSDGSDLGHFFFAVAIFLEITAGAAFKIAIDQVLAGVERPVPERNAFYVNREAEIEAINAEQCAVRSAEAALGGCVQQLDDGRAAFTARVVSLLMDPPSAGHRLKSQNPQTPPMPGRVQSPINGRIAS